MWHRACCITASAANSSAVRLTAGAAANCALKVSTLASTERMTAAALPSTPSCVSTATSAAAAAAPSPSPDVLSATVPPTGVVAVVVVAVVVVVVVVEDGAAASTAWTSGGLGNTATPNTCKLARSTPSNNDAAAISANSSASLSLLLSLLSPSPVSRVAAGRVRVYVEASRTEKEQRFNKGCPPCAATATVPDPSIASPAAG